jgi:hypothetical protein
MTPSGVETAVRLALDTSAYSHFVLAILDDLRQDSVGRSYRYACSESATPVVTATHVGISRSEFRLPEGVQTPQEFLQARKGR